MKQITFMLLSVFALSAFTTQAHAQRTAVAEPLGSIYLSASPTEYVGVMPEIQPGVPFSFYLVIEIDFSDIGQPELNSTDGLYGWEASVELPEGIYIIDTAYHPDRSGNFGLDGTYVMGTGVRDLYAELTPFAVVEFVGMVLDDGVALGSGVIGESSPTSWPGQANWVSSLFGRCQKPSGYPDWCLHPFAFQGDLAFSNARLVPTESQSWGTLKSDFGLE